MLGQILLNRYRVDFLLGTGGMGTVYRVWDEQRAVYLAAKMLHPNWGASMDEFARLREEASTLALLQHPNIVRFYGLEHDNSNVFLLMDYIAGNTLKEKIATSRTLFTLRDVLEIFSPTCASLQYAHSHGIVHCDVKPANILIDMTGRVFLSDFGLARFVDMSRKEKRYGGTPAYMSPEQIIKKPLSARSDIYGLGIILFEMLAGGKRPFRGDQASFSGDTPEKIRWEHLYAPIPSIGAINPALSPDIERIIARCLQKVPEQRYATPIDLLNDLQRTHLPSQSIRYPTRITAIRLGESKSTFYTQSPASSHHSTPQFSPFLMGLVLLSLIFAMMIVFNPFAVSSPISPIMQDDGKLVPELDTRALEPSVSEPQPGNTYRYTVLLEKPERLRWGFSWCASSKEILEENLSQMQFTFIDHNNLSTDIQQFSTFDYAISSLVCRSFYRFVAENWPDGIYTLSTDVTFRQTIHDGKTNYPAGTIRYRYDVQIGE